MDNENPAIILKQWISCQTEQLIKQVIDTYSAKFERKPKRIFVQDTRRWGYCRKNGDIVFNWQLAALPEDFAEYVVIHELTHLSSLNHQKSFHLKLSGICPKYREKERELKNYIAISPNFQFKNVSKPTSDEIRSISYPIESLASPQVIELLFQISSFYISVYFSRTPTTFHFNHYNIL